MFSHMFHRHCPYVSMIHIKVADNFLRNFFEEIDHGTRNYMDYILDAPDQLFVCID